MENSSLIPEILKVFAESDIKIDSTNARTNKNKITTCLFSIRIANKEQLEKAMKKISRLGFVLGVERA